MVKFEQLFYSLGYLPRHLLQISLLIYMWYRKGLSNEKTLFLTLQSTIKYTTIKHTHSKITIKLKSIPI